MQDNIGNMASALMTFAVVAAVALGIFLVLREVWCWYWKINEALKLASEIKTLLTQIALYTYEDAREKIEKRQIEQNSQGC